MDQSTPMQSETPRPFWTQGQGTETNARRRGDVSDPVQRCIAEKVREAGKSLFLMTLMPNFPNLQVAHVESLHCLWLRNMSIYIC
jgi:hypothetical protein